LGRLVVLPRDPAELGRLILTLRAEAETEDNTGLGGKADELKEQHDAETPVITDRSVAFAEAEGSNAPAAATEVRAAERSTSLPASDISLDAEVAQRIAAGGSPSRRHWMLIDLGLDECVTALMPMLRERIGGYSQDELRDPGAVTRILLDHWESVTKGRRVPDGKRLIHRLRDTRNRWAHREVFSADEVVAAIADMASLVERLAGEDTARRLSALTLETAQELGIRVVGRRLV
jgi:hypothetical protein